MNLDDLLADNLLDEIEEKAQTQAEEIEHGDWVIILRGGTNQATLDEILKKVEENKDTEGNKVALYLVDEVDELKPLDGKLIEMTENFANLIDLRKVLKAENKGNELKYMKETTTGKKLVDFTEVEISELINSGGYGLNIRRDYFKF